MVLQCTMSESLDFIFIWIMAQIRKFGFEPPVQEPDFQHAP